MNDEEGEDDLEAIQAHMQMTMALLYDSVDASMKNSTLPNEYGVESLTAFKPRPPRLGIGATPSAKTEVSTSLGRETARLHGRLTGKKRGRDTQDTEDQPVALTNGLKKLKVDQDSSSEEDSRAATISRATKPGDKFPSTAKANVKVDKFAMPKPKKAKKHKQDDVTLVPGQAKSESNPVTKNTNEYGGSLPNGLAAGHSNGKAFKTPELSSQTKAASTLFNASFSVKSDKDRGEASLKSEHAAPSSAAPPHSPLLARHSPLTSRPPTNKRESSTDAYLRSTSSNGLRSNSILSMSSSSSRRSSLSRRVLKRELLRDPRFTPRVVPSNNSTISAPDKVEEKRTEASSKPILQLEPLPKPNTETATVDTAADGEKKKRRRKKKKKRAGTLVAADKDA